MRSDLAALATIRSASAKTAGVRLLVRQLSKLQFSDNPDTADT
jgi:hypothetical protein